MRQQQANRRWEQAVKIFEDLKKITTELGDDKALRLVQIIRSNIINSNAIPESIAKLIDLDNEERRKVFTRQKMGKVLEHMEDLCLWSEWMRSRLGCAETPT